MNKVIQVGNSTITIVPELQQFKTWQGTCGNYYDLIVGNIIEILTEHQPNKHIWLDTVALTGNRDIPNLHNYIKIAIQHEQVFFSYDNKTYEFANPGYYENALRYVDFVFEMSAPGLEFVKTVISNKSYIDKIVVVPNLGIHNTPVVDVSSRIKNVVAVENDSARRKEIKAKVNYDRFITHGGSMGDIKVKVDEYKILLNTLQYDKCKTFNDMRCAALLNTQVLMISETGNCPYLETIPYYKHIVWSDSDTLQDVVVDVLSNYDKYRTKYLSGLDNTVNYMIQSIKNNISACILGSV